MGKMVNVSILGMFVAVSSAGALAQSPSVKFCQALGDDKLRLMCFDNLFKKGKPQEPASVPPKGLSGALVMTHMARLGTPHAKWAHWFTREFKSKMTDDTNIIALTGSLETYSCGSKRHAYAVLVLRCMELKPSIMVMTGCFMSSSKYDRSGYAKVRVDGGVPVTYSMEHSDDHNALGLWDRRWSTHLLHRLLGGKRAVIRVRPYNDNSLTLEFNIEGIGDAVAEARQACAW